jgi:hypothetical protein
MRLLAFSLSILLYSSVCLSTQKVQFIALGDMPYNNKEVAQLTPPKGNIAAAIQALAPPVLIYYGDFKSGGPNCTNKLINQRQTLIANLNPFKSVYTPGDNDWTDCDLPYLKKRFNELERLDYLRSVFFAGDGLNMTRDIAGLKRQPGFVENAQWQIKGLAFGTLHLPGTNNGRDEIYLSDKKKTLNAVERRGEYNKAWVNKLFASAQSAKGLVIAFQADMYRPEITKPYKPCTAKERVNCDGYQKIRGQIERLAAQYKKPVLVVHGDTNAFCLHQPIKSVAANLWRLNGPGDYKIIDAAKVVFDPTNKQMPFTVSAVLSGESFPEVCDYSR